jgi:hypothetical protein
LDTVSSWFRNWVNLRISINGQKGKISPLIFLD